MAIILKKQEITSVGKGVEKLECLGTVDGNVKSDIVIEENSIVVPQKIKKIELLEITRIDLAISFLATYSKGKQSLEGIFACTCS